VHELQRPRLARGELVDDEDRAHSARGEAPYDAIVASEDRPRSQIHGAQITPVSC
jgi:hypothetical protein